MTATPEAEAKEAAEAARAEAERASAEAAPAGAEGHRPFQPPARLPPAGAPPLQAAESAEGRAADEVQSISLSLTASYAPAWGLWEGIRETMQNWHDGLLSAAPPAGVIAGASAAPLDFARDDAVGTAADTDAGASLF